MLSDQNYLEARVYLEERLGQKQELTPEARAELFTFIRHRFGLTAVDTERLFTQVAWRLRVQRRKKA